MLVPFFVSFHLRPAVRVSAHSVGFRKEYTLLETTTCSGMPRLRTGFGCRKLEGGRGVGGGADAEREGLMEEARRSKGRVNMAEREGLAERVVQEGGGKEE